jgi:hypothetical protein
MEWKFLHALQHVLQKGCCLSGTMQESEIHPSNDFKCICRQPGSFSVTEEDRWHHGTGAQQRKMAPDLQLFLATDWQLRSSSRLTKNPVAETMHERDSRPVP